MPGADAVRPMRLAIVVSPSVHLTRWMAAGACERARTVQLRVAEYVRAQRLLSP